MGVIGSGNIFINPKQSGGGGTPAPPFDPSSANEGLSVDPVTGVIQLGYLFGDPQIGAITTERAIDLETGGAIHINNNNSSSGVFYTYPYDLFNTTGFYITGFGGGQSNLSIDANGFFYFLDSGVFNTSSIEISADNARFGQQTNNLEFDRLAQTFELQLANERLFFLDRTNDRYSWGDNVNQTTPVVRFQTNGAEQILELFTNNIIENTNTIITGISDDLGATMQFSVLGKALAGSQTLTINGNVGLDYTDGSTGGRFLNLDQINLFSQIGDVDALLTGANFTIDIQNSLFQFNDTLGAAVIQINGVNGFTGTVTPVNSITVNGGIVTNVT